MLSASLCLPMTPALRAQAAATESAAAIARLSLVDGDVHVATPGYHAEALDAVVNMPLGAGQSLQTGTNADAEVEFSDGSVLRATASSSATIVRLQPQTEIGLDDGLYYLELRAGTDPQFVVYAGDVTIGPQENASLRVRVQNGQAEIAVLRGAISVTRANNYTVDLERGESLRTDAKDSRRYLLADTIGPEPGDSWNERRAQQIADAAASQTIARDEYAGDQGYGWSDLDNSGAWYPLPGEGLVWQPYGVDASFDPYGYGNWVYGGYGASGGYVWASGYSWGWLPYHCGSWGFFSGFGWGWQPAAGCRSFGGGWPVGGFPVKHPPHGWRGPLPPRPPASGGIVTRHPTLPGSPAHDGVHLIAVRPRSPQAIQMNGVTLHALSPVAPAPTPRGSSAVGSALRRDYPVQTETHRPLLGLEREGAAAMPGRAPEWHTPAAVAGRAETQSQAEANERTAVAARSAAGHERAEPATTFIAPGGIAVAPAAAAPNPVFTTGWRNRVLSAQPAPPSQPEPVSRPAGAGAVPFTPSGIRVAPASIRPVPVPVPAQPPAARAPIVVAPTRPMPVVTAPPRAIAPAPVSAPRPIAPPPHFNPPAPSAPVHMGPAPAASHR